MRATPTVENAATWFNAKTVTHHLDVVDRQTASIVDTRTAEGPTCKFGRHITAVDVEYGPADVTVSLIAPFAELVTATRPYTEDEADYLL